MIRPRFITDTRGVSAVEFALLVPILLTLLLGTVTFFDIFRNVQNVEKATFTIGDILSRRTTVTDADLAGMVSLVRNMVPTARDGAIRTSSIRKVNQELVVGWSHVSGEAEIVGTDRALPMDMVPDIANGDSVVLTESFVPHTPFVSAFGLGPTLLTGLSVHRPRFVSAVVYEE